MQLPPIKISADSLALRSSGLDVLIDTGTIPCVSRTEKDFLSHRSSVPRGVLMRKSSHQSHTAVGRTMYNSNRSFNDS